MQTGKKRKVSTCIACYSRKQKCDRKYPCNHCLKRRRPEECVYNSVQSAQSSHRASVLSTGEAAANGNISPSRDVIIGAQTSEILGESREQDHTALYNSFGYSEDSKCNTMALLRKQWDDGTVLDVEKRKLRCPITDIPQDLFRIPPRQILDFLVQYFITELNWFKQLIHPATFLSSYQQWWPRLHSPTVEDLEFATLILRLCSYSAHFLPSRSHNIDNIAGMPLATVRALCSEVGGSLAQSCVALDWNGSLVRVQHCLLAASKFSVEGRTTQVWEAVNVASQAAQKAGIYRDDTASSNTLSLEIEKEMQRRVFCCLYVLDSHLARQLDRVPFLPDNIVETALPRMHLVPRAGDISYDSGAPDMFTERLMQVRLAQFWRQHGLRRTAAYDPAQAERFYERFCTEYLPALHPAFALEPDTSWDAQCPKLAMQRQILHICIFDCICWNFRPALMLNGAQIASFPRYKRVLLESQKRVLAVAADKELTAIASLHAMFNDSHARFGVIIFHTFEACVLLLTLCSQPSFNIDDEEQSDSILGMDTRRFARERLIQAAERGRDRLQTLAEISGMAAAGARVLERLLGGTSLRQSSPRPSFSSEFSWSTTDLNVFAEIFNDGSAFPDMTGGVKLAMPPNRSSPEFTGEQIFDLPMISPTFASSITAMDPNGFTVWSESALEET